MCALTRDPLTHVSLDHRGATLFDGERRLVSSILHHPQRTCKFHLKPQQLLFVRLQELVSDADGTRR